MFIKELAKQTGLATKTIRYYESIGLVPSPHRAENNYREYSPADAERLRFIAAARSLGFSLTNIAEFVTARSDGLLPSAANRTSTPVSLGWPESSLWVNFMRLPGLARRARRCSCRSPRAARARGGGATSRRISDRRHPPARPIR